MGLETGGKRVAARATLLLSAAFFAAPPAAAEVEKQVGVSLTAAADVVSIDAVLLNFNRAPDIFGLAPQVLGVGVDALEGNDQLTLGGTSRAFATVAEARAYGVLPGPFELLLLFLREPETRATSIGVDGGAGNDSLSILGTLEAEARARLEQSDASFQDPFPGLEGLVSTRVGLVADATGAEGGSGDDQLLVLGEVVATADAKAARSTFLVDPVALSVGSQDLNVSGVATGLSGSAGSDRLIVAADGSVMAAAEAMAKSTDLRFEGLRLSSPGNATVAQAMAAGLAGGDGADSLDNAGTIRAAAAASVDEDGVALIVKDFSLPKEVLPAMRQATRAQADAIGLVGGAGADSIINSGTVELLGTASHRQFALTFGDGGLSGQAVSLLVAPPPPPDAFVPEAGAIARIIGLAGDGGEPGALEGGADMLVNQGLVGGVADAEAGVFALSVALPLAGVIAGPQFFAGQALGKLLDSFGIGLSDLSADAFADAVGLAGEAGNDQLWNLGTVNLVSNARSTTDAISLAVVDSLPDPDSGADDVFSVNITVFNTATNAFARTAGLSGGDGRDRVINAADSLVDVAALATTSAAAVAVSAAFDDKALQIDAPVVLSRSWSGAEATGLSGGGGNDIIDNGGRIDVLADAQASALDVLVSLSLVNGGGAVNAAISDTRVRSDATAIGIADGGGPGQVRNSGSIGTNARATSRSTGVNVGLAINNAAGLSATGAFLTAGDEANATARGIAMEATDPVGRFALAAGGEIGAHAEADSGRTGTSVNIGFANSGLTITAPVLRADSLAVADAAILSGFNAAGQFETSGSKTADAVARASSTNVAVGLSVGNSGVAAGVTGLLSGTMAEARSAGLVLGERADTLSIADTLAVLASADARQTGVGVAVGGAALGLGVGATLADLETRAFADATGVDTGDDDDVVDAIGSIFVDALATGNAAGVGVGIAGATNGVSLSAALARSGLATDATARGIALGGGSDRLVADGELRAKAAAEGRTVDVNVALGGTAQGVALGAALADVRTSSTASAIGADGGAGADLLIATGPVAAMAVADGTATGIAASLEIAVAGLAGAGSGLFGQTLAHARAAGLDGGLGADWIEASGPMDISAFASGRRTAVGVALSGAQGVAVGGTVILADLDSTAAAFALSGDGPNADAAALGMDEGDVLLLLGPATVRAEADATAISVGVTGAVGIGFSASLLSAALVADAAAVGLDGGFGADTLGMEGTLDLVALASAQAPTVSFNLAGASFGDIDSQASARSIGLDGGDGEDLLLMAGTLSADSRAAASGALVQVTAAGGALGKLGTAATAESIGLSGGSGDDVIAASGWIDLFSEARTSGVVVDLAVLGIAVPDASGVADARSIGLAGGDGRDALRTTGPVTLVADAAIFGSSVAATLFGGSIATLETRADAEATALDGGADGDSLALEGGYGVLALADSRSLGIALNGEGVGLVRSTTIADARALGLAGGAGLDTGDVIGTGVIEARSVARTTNVAVTMAGVGALAPGIESLASAGLGDGGDGDDLLWNVGRATVVADASGVAGATNIAALGATITSLSGLAHAQAFGLGGGADADRLGNLGVIDPHANAVLSAGTQRLSVAGASLGTVATEARADAIGLDGGDGDDVIENFGTLTPLATAQATTSAVDVLLVGAVTGRADATALADATAVGLSGGDGVDQLWNAASGTIAATAATTGAASGVSVVVAGAGLADSGVVQTAHAIGLDGGSGADTLLHEGAITLDARATGGASIVNVTLLGAADGDASVETTAEATGLAGGSEDDILVSRGSISGSATATGKARNVSVGVAGALLGGADNRATAIVRGLDGGDGHDQLFQSGTIDLVATATGSAGNTAVTVAGFGAASATSDNLATALGLAGGAGHDQLLATGTIVLSALASQTANSRSIAILGAATARGGLYATATGALLDGGDGDDVLQVASGADLRLTGASTITSSGSTVNIVGSAATRGLARAEADLAGLAGGDGNDLLLMAGSLAVDGTATTTKTGSSFTLAGGATSGGDVKPLATVTGIDAGEGDDVIAMTGDMSATATTSASSSSSSFALAGYAADGVAIGSEARATGIATGGGANSLVMTGSAASTARATSRLNSNVTVTFGATAANRAPTGASAYATGVAGGSLADMMMLEGLLSVLAFADAGFTNTRFVTAGGSGGSNNGVALSSAIGVAAGGGANDIRHSGILSVDSESRTVGNGAAGVTFGNTTSASEAVARSELSAVSLGTGPDLLWLGGTSASWLTATARSVNTVTTGALFSDGIARSRARTELDGQIVRDSGGDSDILVTGTHTLRIFGDRGSLRGVSRAEATSNGVTVGISASAQANSEARGQFQGRGIQLGNGVHRVELDGAMTLFTDARVSATATANGNTLVSGFGTAQANAIYNSSALAGIDSAGSGHIFIRPGRTLLVEARPTAATSSSATSTGIDFVDPDANATTLTRVDSVVADGLRLGSGGHEVVNEGSIRAISAPRADRSISTATGVAAGVSISADAFAYATASANGAQARGIAATDGANLIVNRGLIEATSSPYAEARAVARGNGPDGDVIARAHAEALNANAYGIQLGSGADTVVNEGTIQATSSPVRVRTVVATPGEFCVLGVCVRGSRSTRLSGSTSGEAVGIDTGDGDDLVVNLGAINAPIGIRTGDGNDRVELRGGTVTGSVLLGAGDDVLRLEGGIMLGLADGGSGSDTFELTGAGFFGLGLQTGFENAVKTGPGTFNLRLMPGTGTLTIHEGAIALDGIASLKASHQLNVQLRPDGSSGQLLFGSLAAGTTLAGGLAVDAVPGVYSNGTSWQVAISPTRFNGNFAVVDLPAPTALRSFSSGLVANRIYQVSVAVAPMVAVVTRAEPLVRSFAAALDNATPVARGQVAQLIAGLQAVPTEAEVSRALGGLAPRLPALALGANAAALDSGLAILASRPGSIAGTGLVAPQGLSLRSTPAQLPGSGSWAAAFSGASGLPGGGLGEMSGFASGMAMPLGTDAQLDFGIVRSRSSHAHAGAIDSGGVQQTLFGVGLSTRTALPWGDSPLRIEANLAAGQSRFAGGRGIGGAEVPQSTQLKQDSRTLAATIDAAVPLGEAPWSLVAGLSWRQVDSGSASETVKDGLSLTIADSRSQRAETHLGLRWASAMAAAPLPLSFDLKAGWLHRLSAQGGILASFHDMPEHRFALQTDRLARNALALDASARLRIGHASDMSLVGMWRLGDETATGRPVQGVSLAVTHQF